MTIIKKKQSITSVDKVVKKLEPAYSAGGNVKWFIYFGKQFGQFLEMLNLELPYDSAILFLPKRVENICPHKNLYTHVHSSIVHNVVVQLLSYIQLFATLWTIASQASLSFTFSWSLLKFISIESVMLSNHLILCYSCFSSCLQSFPASGSFHNSQNLKTTPMSLNWWMNKQIIA